MLFNRLAVLAGLASVATAAPSAQKKTLSPWQVTELRTGSPSGRPGSSPWATMNLTISEPNTIIVAKTKFPPQTATCGTQWTAAGGNPYGVVNTCVSSGKGTWTFEVIQSADADASPTRDFLLKFTLVDAVPRKKGASASKKTFVGTGAFKVGDNFKMVCGASGVCSTSLKPENTPFSITQQQQQVDQNDED
jgi:hypothetical protein